MNYWNNPQIGEELFVEMENNLRKNAFIRDTSDNRDKIEAIELLSTAANNFDILGRKKEAEAMTTANATKHERFADVFMRGL
jgi:hypothetical protein